MKPRIVQTCVSLVLRMVVRSTDGDDIRQPAASSELTEGSVKRLRRSTVYTVDMCADDIGSSVSVNDGGFGIGQSKVLIKI